jgi:glycosyltransferase involved in cell wall biosynthesis
MRRVLIGFVIDGKKGGTDVYLMKFLRTVYSKDLQMDFLSNFKNDKLKKTLNQYNSKLYIVSNLKRPFQQYQQICQIIDENQYDTVYLNVSTAVNCVAALAAKHCHVEHRIIHSHSSGYDSESAVKRLIYEVLHFMCRPWLRNSATKYVACSVMAGRWLFGKKIAYSDRLSVISNSVNSARFVYNPQKREQVRKKLGINEDTLVIGNVGGLSYAKNQDFLIHVFAEVKKKREDAILVVVGEGERLEMLQQLTEKYQLVDSVRFLGWRKDVDELMQALDIFVLPSHFEGMPTVAVEAQCAGLPCLLSNAITKEAKITDRCFFLPLGKSYSAWAEYILQHVKYDRENFHFLSEKSMYDAEAPKGRLESIIYD